MHIVPEAPKIHLGPSGHAVLKAYLSLLLIGGHVGLPLALGTMFVSRAASRRYPTLNNMLVSWIIYTTAALLLFYAGQYQNREPDFCLCLAQASLIYGGTVMVGSATLCLVLQLWLEIRGRNVTYVPLRSRVLLVAAPWLTLMCVTVLAIAYGSVNTSRVSYRWLFYCTLSSDAVINTVAGITLATLAVMFYFEVSILWTLYKASRQIRATDRSSYHMSIRVSIFAGCTVVTFVIAGVNILIPTLIFPYLFISILPLSAFAIFGTTQDNVAVWTRCLRRPLRREYGNAIKLEPIEFRPRRIGCAVDSSGSVNQEIKRTKQQSDVVPTESTERLHVEMQSCELQTQ